MGTRRRFPRAKIEKENKIPRQVPVTAPSSDLKLCKPVHHRRKRSREHFPAGQAHYQILHPPSCQYDTPQEPRSTNQHNCESNTSCQPVRESFNRTLIFKRHYDLLACNQIGSAFSTLTLAGLMTLSSPVDLPTWQSIYSELIYISEGYKTKARPRVKGRGFSVLGKGL